MQPALGVSSGCVRFRNASDSRAILRSAAGSPSADRELRPEQNLAGLSAGGCHRSRTTSRRAARRSRRRPGSRAARAVTRSPIRRPAKCALPKTAPPTVPGVPAHASRPAQPCLIVQRTRPLIVTAASARTLLAPVRRMSPPRVRMHEPADAGVRRRARSNRRRASSRERRRERPARAPSRTRRSCERRTASRPVRRPGTS